MNFRVITNGAKFLYKFRPLEIIIIIDNLFSNSMKAGARNITVSLATSKDDGLEIAVKDDGKGTVNYEKVWVESIETNRDGNKSTGKLTTTPVKPITSWFSKPGPRLSDFGNQPFQNVAIYNGGTITTLSQTLPPTETAIMYVSGNLASAPS